jgi:hypothetical protein
MYRWPADNDPHSGDGNDDNNNDEENSERNLDHFHYGLPSSSPRDALQPIIAEFRGLHYIIKPPWDGSEHELLVPEAESEFTTSDDPDDLLRGTLYRHLKDLYLECGWDTDAVSRRSYRSLSKIGYQSGYT